MKKFIFIYFITFPCFSFATWDIEMSNFSSDNVSIKMELVSVPFEGLNRYNMGQSPYNRIGIIQYGCYHRRFLQSPTIFADSQIVKYESFYRVASTFSEIMHLYPMYGFGKYLITITNNTNSSRSIKFYWNTLDSKIGSDSIRIQGDTLRNYRCDWGMSYIVENGVAFCVVKATDYEWRLDTIFTNQQYKELSYWKLFTSYDNPREKNFYIRSTPFPLSLDFAENYTQRRFVLGTKAIMDTVYQDIDSSFNNYSYNTNNNYFNNITSNLPFNSPGNTYSTPGGYNTYNYPNGGLTLIIDKSDTLILEKNKKFFINGQTEFGDSLIIKGALILEENAEIFPINGGKIVYDTSNVDWNNLSCNRAFRNSDISFTGSIEHTIDNNGFIVIDSLANLRIDDNTSIVFSGNNSNLWLKNGSRVILGQNAKLKFVNGAYLKADGVNFLTEGGDISEGLLFENAGGQTEIKNCTFTNAKNPIKIINDSASAYSDKKIIGNTFNMPSVTGNCIYAQNVFKILIQNNYFNMYGTTLNQIGLYIRNNYNAGYPSEEAPMPLYQLNILSNSFSSGTIGMALMNTAGIMIPFYVFDNRFIGTSNSYYGIISRKITGDIKNTKFTNTNINQGIRLDLCDVNLYNNEVKSNYESIRYNGVSTVTMAPLIIGENGINYNWKGGRNKLNSKYASNVMIDYSSLPKLDYGNNCFELQTTSTGSHLVGTSSISPDNPYYCRNNGWTYTSGVQLSNITYNGNIILPYLTPIISCGNTPVFDSYSYTEMGFGIYDTVGVSEREDTTTIPEDEALFTQANYYYEESDFTSAIVLFKTLIDNNQSSNELPEAVWTMYSAYSQLDTSNSETYRDDLYSECKLYLENKINSNNYQNEFVDAAYQVILMCEANLQNYNHAMDGYEFIINFHPDPVIRINASWDYEDLESLLGQGGAGKMIEQTGKTAKTNEEYRTKRLKKLLRIINNDPVKQHLLKIYDKKVTEEYNNKTTVTEKITKINISVSDRKKIEQKIYNATDQRIIQKSIENVMRAGSRTEEEKQKSLIDDLVMSSGMEIHTDNNISGEIIPIEYRLNQNYPNPFNPITNISYQIANEGFVTLKVFDLLGREITKLVNEINKPGTYEVSFNGANLSSGIYFYRLEVYYENVDKNFIDTKRMVLVK